jgi:signal transduction histidine kinase
VADAERRRLERDLHDGAQADLAAIAVKVQLTRALLSADPAAVPGVLDEIEAELGAATAALRALAHGIFPSLLLTGGLPDALAGVAAQSPADVRVGPIVRGRFPREVEAAVYFCCVEAVHNAAKHAGPGVRITLDVVAHDNGRGGGDGCLTFTVRDDGAGFDPAVRSDGHGLTNMVDRLGALGGTLAVMSCPGAGTTVRGTLPVGEVSGTAR